MDTNKHTKQKQFEILVDFMCSHPDLAKGHLKTPDAKQTSSNLWQRFASQLNAEGPPMRDAVGWKKVWADHKCFIKSKLRKNKQSVSGTGGEPSKYCSFTPSEELVINLLNMDESVSGISSARVFGVCTTTGNSKNAPDPEAELLNNDEMEQDITELLNSDEHEKHIKAPAVHIEASRCTPRNKENLLHKQVENQIEYHKNSCHILKDINENLTTIAKYQQKKIRFERKKVQIGKRKI